MGKPKDVVALECYRQVLLTLGHVTDYVRWKPRPAEWVARELPTVSIKLVRQAMQRHVAEGGQVDQIEETRPEYVSWRFHYDIRLPLSGRRIYIETILEEARHLEDCSIWVVSIHDQ